MAKLDKILYLLVTLFFVIPISIWLIFWFKWYVSLPLVALFWYLAYQFTTRERTLTNDQYRKIFNKKKWIVVSVIVILLNVLSGAGGLFYQNWDYRVRDAVFSDLIQQDWPVTYDYHGDTEKQFGMHKGLLTYYFAWFLPGAIVGKAFGFTVGSLFLLLQQIVGCLLFFYLIFRYLKAIKIRYVALFFILSGADIIGRVVLTRINGGSWGPLVGSDYIDVLPYGVGSLALPSFTTQLFWILNTAVPAWLITALLLNEKDYKFIGLLLLFLIPFSPFPAVVLVLLIGAFIITKQKDKIFKLKDLLSWQNIACILPLLPIAMLFLSNSSGQAKGLSINRILSGNNDSVRGLLSTTIVYLCELAVFAVIARKGNRKQLFSYLIVLFVMSMFFLGDGLDLSMKGSGPALIAIYALFCGYISEWGLRMRLKLQDALVALMLTVGSITPLHEVIRSISYTHYDDTHHVSNYALNWGTFSEVRSDEMLLFVKNFVSPYNSDSTLARYVLR